MQQFGRELSIVSSMSSICGETKKAFWNIYCELDAFCRMEIILNTEITNSVMRREVEINRTRKQSVSIKNVQGSIGIYNKNSMTNLCKTVLVVWNIITFAKRIFLF